MAIGTTAALGIGLGASALGSFLNKRSERGAARQQQGYGQQASQRLFGAMQQGPSALEMQGQQMLGQGVDINTLLGGGFNVGQDYLMQSLRTDPFARSGQTLEGIIGGQGNPFDTSGLFEALGAIDQRNLGTSVAGLHAGAAGLGQRFGGAARNAEAQLRQGFLQDTAARNAGIGLQSHEAAQGRLLDATQLLQGGELAGLQGRMGAAQLLQQGGLGRAGLGLQAQGQQGQLLQALLGAQQGRQAYNANLLGAGLQAGAPVPMPGYGDVIGSLGAAVPGFLTTQMLLNNPQQFYGRRR